MMNIGNIKEIPKHLDLADSMGSSRRTSLQHIKGSRLEEQDSLVLPMFEFDSILIATNNFSTTNKLGQGGYGPVYQVIYCIY